MNLARLLAAALLLVGLAALPAQAAQCARPGADGAVTGLTGVINGYWPATAGVAAGATTITLGAAAGALTPIAAGDLLLVIQMQDTAITATNSSAYGAVTDQRAGVYEFVRAASAVSAAGGTLTLVGGSGGGLLNAYRSAAATATAGQRRFQVVRVPQYATATLGSGLTALAWDGARGGVLAFDVRGDFTLGGGTADVSGRGFRGGGGRQLAGGAGANTDYATAATVATNGAKGEGVAGTPRYVNNAGALLNTAVVGYPPGSLGRGAPANGGGGGTDGRASANDQNTGGGGGAGAGAGGVGGHAWCEGAPVGCSQSGGVGGRAVSLSATRLTTGGGGGAGSSNNGSGTPGAGFASSGAAGGGVIIVRAGRLVGSGTFRADGANANATVGNDGSGGGGGGGSILISSASLAAGAAPTVSARGGAGGINTGGGAAHGPGGGGGGGFVVTSFTAAPMLTGGAPGTTANGGTFGATYGATAGLAGGTATVTGDGVSGASAGHECTPVLTKAFATSPIVSGGISRLTLTLSNPNPTLALTGAAFTDTYPTAIRNAATVNPANACGGTATAAAGGGSAALAGGSVPAAASCTVQVDVTSATSGAHVNTVPAGGLTGSYGAVAVAGTTAATATLVVSEPLTATKTSQTTSDPINGAINPKAIPGALVTYTITVTNPGSVATDAGTVSVSDAMPTGTALFVGDLAGAGSGPIRFVQGTPPSGLTYAFTALASTSDNLSFSSDGGASFGYTPVPNANGVDPAVTHVRAAPGGAQAAGGVFAVQFAVRLP